MQIQNAIQTPVLVTNSDAPLEKAGAVALKEITSVNNKFRLDVEALENLDVKDVEYEVYVDLLTDEKEIKEFDLDNDGELDSKQYLTTKSQRIKGAYVFVNEQKVTDTQGATFKIKPGQKKKLDVAFLLPANLKKGTFVEGYVRLVPTGKNSDKAVPLTVPYMGYYGKWDEPKNIDPAAWEKDAFLGYTALWNDEGARFPMGYNPISGTFNIERIVLSPNAVVPGAFSTFTSLRNLQKTEMYVENDKGELVQYLGDFSEYTGQPWKFRKNIMVYRNYMNQGYLWNMRDQNGQFVKDGNYQYVIKTTLDYPGAKPQEVKMPIKIDSVAPVVSDIRVQPKDGQYEISFTAKDNENGSGYNGAVIWYNGKYKALQEGQTSTLVKEEPKSVVVMGVDYALNQSYTIWGDPSYITADMFVSYFSVSPSQNINASKPARVNGFANNRVDWAVNVRDASGNVVDSMTIQNEHEIHLEWKPEANLPSGTYTISADVTNKQGFKVTTQAKTVTVLQP
ncbi:Fn3-like domain-containing protein [Ectobacillus sp. JY-23]|nr:Fn3-like domain-containing protein [Ectobacillus sp. JY-23]